MTQLLLSPSALRYFPVLLLHLVSLGYLLLRRPRSRQSRLFCGWLAGMTVMTASQCAAWTLYGSQLSMYLEWWGGIAGVSLALIFLLQFAYAFPRRRYNREARLLLALSVLITAALFTFMAGEALVAVGTKVYATEPGAGGVALASRVSWFIYDFERFGFGAVAQRSAGALTSFRLFNGWQIIGHLWVLGVWLRKTLQEGRGGYGLWGALFHPRSREARASRAWLLMMCLFPLPVVASILDGANVLPPGTFAVAHLLVLFGIMLTYVNYSPEPTTFMTKLVGLSLVTLLATLGFVSSAALRAHRTAYSQMRRAELRHVAALLDAERFDSAPPDILYVAARRLSGLFASDYQRVVARPGAPEATTLAAHDALLREGLARRHYPTRYAVLHENPWLGLQGVRALEGGPSAKVGAAVEIPPDVMSYRGSSAVPEARIVRYTFTHAGTRYEVGYRYLDYRRSLHRAALPLAALMVGTTVGVLVIFPHFFRVSLVAPLMELFDGLNRVNRGARRVRVSVRAEDEIGAMTHAFNQMVESLRASEAQLGALNLTLEQRVADRTQDLVTLYELSALLNRADSLPSLLADVLAQVVPAVDGAAGLIVLAEGDEILTLTAAHGVVSAHIGDLAAHPLWQKICERGECTLIHDLTVEDAPASLASVLTYATLIGVPIPGQMASLGALVIFGETPYLFNVEDLELLGTIAEQLGVAVENARLRERAAEALVVEERQRLARDLHDSVTQLLYSQTLFAEGAALSLEGRRFERAMHCVTRLRETSHRALREMRLMIYRLRPAELAELGLVGALRRRLEIVERRAGIAATLTDEGVDCLSPLQEEALYRSAEEALNNALKHAGASEVRVELRREGRSLVLSVSDDGCGFDPEGVSSGFGLQSLRERAAGLGGTFVIESAADAGTQVVVRLPGEVETTSPR